MSIIGNTVGAPNPRPDWNQNDSKKADYIKNKPSELLTNVDAHLKNKSNPHGVTPAQIGAAPASGFVSTNSVGSVEELDAWIDALVAAQEVGTRKTYYTVLRWYANAALPTGRWSITIHKPDVADEPTWAGVTATVIASQRIHHLQRELYDGTWLPWEWENPNMELGKEYRTTERWQGKAVYTNLVDCGALPNAATKEVNLNFKPVYLISHDICYVKNNFYYSDLTDVLVYVASYGGNAMVRITTVGDNTEYHGYCTIRYTKD